MRKIVISLILVFGVILATVACGPGDGVEKVHEANTTCAATDVHIEVDGQTVTSTDCNNNIATFNLEDGGSLTVELTDNSGLKVADNGAVVVCNYSDGNGYFHCYGEDHSFRVDVDGGK